MNKEHTFPLGAVHKTKDVRSQGGGAFIQFGERGSSDEDVCLFDAKIFGFF